MGLRTVSLTPLQASPSDSRLLGRHRADEVISEDMLVE